MSDIRKFSVNPTAKHHLRDANDQPMYADGADGNPDLSKPITVNLYGPGSKVHARAQSAQQNRFVERLRRKNSGDQTPEQSAVEKAQFLTGCTESFENLEYDNLKGEALAMAVYSDLSIGFIADQVAKVIGDWSNFTKTSSAS